MNCPRNKFPLKSANRVTDQVNTLREDLERALGIVINLADLNAKHLERLGLEGQIQDLHQSLKGFEFSCLKASIENQRRGLQQTQLRDKSTPFSAQDEPDWQKVQSDAQRANQLARQLSSTLSRIHSSLDGISENTAVPQEIHRLNQSLNDALSELANEWNKPVD